MSPKNGKDFQCPWTDLRWMMLLTWRLFLINFEAFNISKDYAEIRCAENISARLDSAWHSTVLDKENVAVLKQLYWWYLI